MPERIPRTKLNEDYRIRCPEGHTSLVVSKEKPTAFCKVCSRTYEHADLVDLKSVERKPWAP